ncbi:MULTISPECIES: TspO/MBR family protein [unclassified Leucobacter]|uniref:TspO/MBR family protein n=1 Tax=unclassified Leucobacter TaxID=2621730 RepID=UPI003016BFCB
MQDVARRAVPRPTVARQIAVGVAMLAAVALVAWGGSLASITNIDGWYAEAHKAPWSPPNAVFGPVWSVLYALIALAGWLIWRSGARSDAPNAAPGVLRLFVTQLVLNALWTPVFFAGYPLMGAAAWWVALAIMVALMASVILLGITAAPLSRIASWIMIPYLLWLIFATSLNVAVIALN